MTRRAPTRSLRPPRLLTQTSSTGARRPDAAVVLTLGGIVRLLLGLYFVFFRPALLPEDARFLDRSMAQLQSEIPRLQIWTRRVFWVLGGFMFTSGVLTCYVAVTSFRARTRGSASVVALSGLTSIGAMAAVNVVIDSDFKWLLLAFTVPWVLALALYRLDTRRDRQITGEMATKEIAPRFHEWMRVFRMARTSATVAPLTIEHHSVSVQQ